MNKRVAPLAALSGVALAIAGAPAAQAAPAVFESAGATKAAMEQKVADFRTLLGAPNGNGAPAPAGRRDITWDGGDAGSSPNLMPANAFGGRGVVFTTPGTGFLISQDDDDDAGQPDADPDLVRFDDLEPGHSAQFQAFSPERLFTALGSTITDVHFQVPGTDVPATTSGFGAVFTDVETNASSLEYFDDQGKSLGTFTVPQSGQAGLSFLGVAFDAGERVSRVRIGSGSRVASEADDPQGAGDVVTMDDFTYAEPQPVVRFSASSYSVDEDAGQATITLARAGGGAATVDFATADGSALAGSDYAATSGTISFAADETAKTVTVPITPDALAERGETVVLRLTGPTGAAALGSGRDAALVIADVPPAPAPPAPPADDRRPGLTLEGVPARIRRAALLRGLRVAVTPDEPVSLQAELIGRARSARIARTGDLVLASRSLDTAAVRRTLRLRPSARLLGRARRAQVVLRVTAVDAAGNRTVVSRRIAVRR